MSQPHQQIHSGKATPAYPRTVTSLGYDIDVSLSLLQLLASWDCGSPKEAKIRRLAKTDREYQELEALLSQWQALGRPTSVFWRET
jgi:hypothetical protein